MKRRLLLLFFLQFCGLTAKINKADMQIIWLPNQPHNANDNVSQGFTNVYWKSAGLLSRPYGTR